MYANATTPSPGIDLSNHHITMAGRGKELRHYNPSAEMGDTGMKPPPTKKVKKESKKQSIDPDHEDADYGYGPNQASRVSTHPKLQ
jgi:hypothetical protein